MITPMNSRTDLLRERIALYRSYLRTGRPVAEATEYLREIQRDEAELRTIAKQRDRDQGYSSQVSPPTHAAR